MGAVRCSCCLLEREKKRRIQRAAAKVGDCWRRRWSRSSRNMDVMAVVRYRRQEVPRTRIENRHRCHRAAADADEPLWCRW